MTTRKTVMPPHLYDPLYEGDPSYCKVKGCSLVENEHSHSLQDEIIIERREIIGKVKLGEGEEPALKVAFGIASEYVANHGDVPLEVQFEIEGLEYYVGARNG